MYIKNHIIKKYILYIGAIAAVVSNIDGTISFISRIGGNDMSLHDLETLIRIVLTFGIVYFMGSMYYHFKKKILAIKKYNEERFEIVIKSIKTHLQQNIKEHDAIATSLKKINPEITIEEGKDERIKELWDKIKSDFDKIQKEYDYEFQNWIKTTR